MIINVADLTQPLTIHQWWWQTVVSKMYGRGDLHVKEH